MSTGDATPSNFPDHDDRRLVSVVMPAYGEEATIEVVLRRVCELDLHLEMIVVDDGSKDRTVDIVEAVAKDLGGKVKLLRHDRNRGKGAAVRTGIAASKGDIVVIQDADLEYDPRDLPRLLGPLLEGVADVVYGTPPARRRAAARAPLLALRRQPRALLLTNVLYNTTISDMEVGYKAFRGDLIRSIELVSDDFGFEPEVTAKLLRRDDIRLYEVPISYYGRTYAEGKKITWRDGVRAVIALVRFRFGD